MIESWTPSSRSPVPRSKPTQRVAVRLSIAIQHHPARADLIPALLEAMPSAEVVTDPEPDHDRNPWRTYRECLERTPEWATHRLIVQDDARPCQQFEETVQRAVEAYPARPISLFHGGQPAESVPRLCRAYAAKRTWVEIHSRWTPVVALVWPAEMIRPALEFVDTQRWPPAFQADDEIAGRCFSALGVAPLATVPSLVQHDDIELSLVGQRARGGDDLARVAMTWLDDDDDPALLDFDQDLSW